MKSLRILTHSLSLALLVAALFASPVFGQAVSVSAVNNSLCFWSDTDNDQSTPVAYDPSNLSCVETGASDLNVFGVTSATSGNGTSAAQLDVDAALVVDANPASSEYQAGRILYGLTISITGTSGGAWDLTVDQQMQGLLATVDDGAGLANASITGVTAALNLGPSLSFGTLSSWSSGSTGSVPFSASQAGDVIQGVGDTVLTGSLEITLDAYSECGGLFCLGLADEGAVLFGIDDVSGSIFVTADQYSTWGRAVGPDGYQASFSVALTGPICGDGNTDPGEECDDGGTVDGDGCSSICVIEFCGDGVQQPGLGEQCDDGNTDDGDGCSSVCLIEVVTVPALSAPGLVGLGAALVAAALFAALLPRRSRARARASGGPAQDR
jgi:cysteine-rich repeat protein